LLVQILKIVILYPLL